MSPREAVHYRRCDVAGQDRVHADVLLGIVERVGFAYADCRVLEDSIGGIDG
jgi:hypothetical protein